MPKYLWLSAVAGMLCGPASANASASFDADSPRGTYVWLEPGDFAAKPHVALGGEPHVLFLNRCSGGLTVNYSPQTNNSVTNESSIGGGTFPEYPFGEDSWQDIVTRTRLLFSPYNVLVTDVDPSPAPHDEAIVCGNPSILGLQPNVGGVAPFNCGQIPNAVSFTFAEQYGGDTEQMVATIGQEAAHAWGLEHLLRCNDPMTYLNSPWSDEGACWPKSYQDVDAQCGEGSPRPCQCGGTTQNSHQLILGLFGPAIPDAAPPTAAIVAPADDEYFNIGSEFDIEAEVSDDGVLTEVRLFSNGEVLAVDTSEPFGPWPAVDIPEGDYAFHLEAEDAAGNVTVSDVVTIHVTPGGFRPDDTDGGESSGTGDGDSSDGGDDSDGGTGVGETQASGDGLPDSYGASNNNDATTGCGCTQSPERGGSGWALLLLSSLLVIRRRRPQLGLRGYRVP